MRRWTAASAVAVLAIGAIGSMASAADGCSDAPHAGGEWPTYGHDLANTRNQSAETTISAANVGSLEPAWVFSVEAAGGVGTIESTPMVSGGCAFVGTQAGWVYAIDIADGSKVWERDLGSTVTTLSVANGRVFADVSIPNEPQMAALDADTGEVLWRQTLIEMSGSDATGSPLAFGDKVATGISCIGAEGSSGDARLACRGALVIVDQVTGEILSTAFGIPDEDFENDYAGGGIWSTPGVDLETGYLYVGAGNPFSEKEHPRTAAILKVDVDDARSTFGTVVDSYKATSEQYLPVLGARKPLCEASGFNVGVCEFPDLDMATAPNIFTDSRGRTLVGAGQSAGLFHTVRADTMEYVWTAVTGPPTLGTRSGGAAFDGERLFVNGGPGITWALGKDEGRLSWVVPSLGSNTHTAQAVANGVVYTATGNGFPVSSLLALDAETGDVLLARPFAPDIADLAQSVQAGGPSVARNTIFAPVNGLGAGYVVAYKLPA